MSSPKEFAQEAAEAAAEEGAEEAAEAAASGGGIPTPGLPVPSSLMSGDLASALMATEGGVGVEKLMAYGLPEGPAHIAHGLSMIASELVGFDASTLDGFPAIGHILVGIFKSVTGGEARGESDE